MSEQSATDRHDEQGFRRNLTGRVISNKMDKTVVVECVTATKHGLYGKYVRSRKRYKAHDEGNACKVGDQVEIREHRPILRQKRWMVIKLVKKFVEE